MADFFCCENNQKRYTQTDKRYPLFQYYYSLKVRTMAHEEMLKKSSHEAVSYKDTLNLPTTDFPIRAQASIDDPLMIARWKKEEIYKKSFEKNKGSEKFVLHDGPPYANGNIHLGTAFNKILKDIFPKFHRMAGKHAPITPGWDCHGLPIEFKVTQEFPELKGDALKAKCRAYATGWITEQKRQFQDLGVLMNWDHPYLTMNPSYEAATVRAFAEFVAAGYIKRQNKTVPWCASCHTVLAAAEIEYADRKDPSLYVLFPFTKDAAFSIFPEAVDNLYMVIWTTTPWTLPLNKAVMVKPGASYDVVLFEGKYCVIGSALSEAVCKKIGQTKTVVKTIKAEQLLGQSLQHPFIEGQLSPFVGSDFVSLEDGTAAVHCAPGCGQEDYEVGVKNDLPIFSPITVDGRYDKGILPASLEGTQVTQAHGTVITLLQSLDRLLHKESLNHSYPHCWRCRNGLIFRATKQWFCNLAHNDLRQRALDAIETIQFIPEGTKNRLKASVGGRLEWCLSRQRIWGTPIIALVCTSCDTEFVSYEMIHKVADGISCEGIEHWDRLTVQDVLPSNAVCSSCKSITFRKETDTLDVWFDSGVSHYAVLKDNQELSYPASIYSEGSDQHRGWFQSSLLTSVALSNRAPMKTILTHGYTVDAQGKKMSKSLGNVVVPSDMIKEMGTDGLRLWAASIGRESDAVVSKVLIENVKEVFRKIRNTSRFLVSNLYDFDFKNDAIAPADLFAIDQYALQKLYDFDAAVRKAYENYDATTVYHAFTDYCTAELSSFYLDIIKDRLYTDAPASHARRSAQTACWYILHTMTQLMAPILSFTAEQLSDCYQKNKKESIHLQTFDAPINLFYNLAVKEGVEGDAIDEWIKKRQSQWEALREVRSMILKAIEKIRQNGTVKHSLESGVTLIMDTRQKTAAAVKELLAAVEKQGQAKESFLREYCIVSTCDITETETDIEYEDLEDEDLFSDCLNQTAGIAVTADHAAGVKCPRCWQWEVTDHAHGLCTRCQTTVSLIRK